jgi:predicted ATPase
VLDNFEHVMDAWPVVTRILRAAPGVVVLVTSRSPLEISGEQRFVVSQLSVPPADAHSEVVPTFDAVRLFTARARLADRGFAIDAASAGAVAELCRRLDGLPLAIELAAALVAGESRAEFLASVPTGFGSLAGGPRDVPDRQRTLRDTIDWSYQMLEPAHRVVFDALGAFAAAPDRAAIHAVAGGGAAVVSDALDELVRHSLSLRDATGPEPRFPMLQTVRSYARERLSVGGGELPARRRHAEHYRTVAEVLVARLHGPGQIAAFDRLHRDRPEFDAALDWAAGIHGDGGDVALALRLVGCLWDYWQTSGDVAVPRQRALDVLARDPHHDPAVRAAAASGAGTLCWLGGDLSAATRLHAKALQMYRILGDRVGVAWSTMCLSVQQVHGGTLDEAEVMAREALTLATAADAPLVVSNAHTVLGVLAFYRGDRAQADSHQLRALAIAREMGDEQGAAQTLINLSDIAEEAGEWARAGQFLTESLQISARLGDKVKALFAIEATAELRLRLGAPKDAARLLAAARRHRTAMAHPLDAREQAGFDQIVEQTRAAAGAVAFAIASAEGRSLTFDEAVAEALA